MGETSRAVTRSRKKGILKALSGKERRHIEEARIAREMCVDPPFLKDFPQDVRDLVTDKLFLYHVRLGTKAFNLIAPVMLIHLMERSSIGTIPEISRHSGWFLQYIFC